MLHNAIKNNYEDQLRRVALSSHVPSVTRTSDDSRDKENFRLRSGCNQDPKDLTDSE
ncbi:hypothetical protein PROFUN_14462 [Planoprotostelium fungivorum]|uniref:Uncharacterized protein n=1 Tax=Planoprotostelium fungivorum TaxID=1890364 RepID=A0A2P6MXA9_9EUKA|nr:hypothetical protein PROFUN_14462 [Planoprotostelium fungivorum]